MPTNLVEMSFSEDRCAVCASSDRGGTLTFTAEVRTSVGTWGAVATIEDLLLCYDDYDRFTAYADAITGGDPGSPMLGLPMRPTAVSLGAGHCDCCQAELHDHASTVELVPTAQVYRRGSRTHRDGALRRLRVCRVCLGWWRSTVIDPAAMLGHSRRATEGAAGGWLNPGHGDAVAYALRGRDLAILATTMEADETAFRRIVRPGELHPAETVFVAAGKRDRAASFVRALDPSLRHRVAIVAHSDQLEDAKAALQAGAGELLASPLSPQQVVGALVRTEHSKPARKDSATGLSILEKPRTVFGRSCLAYTIQSKQPAQLLEIALVARRFLRGYDELGSDGRGGLRVHAYAEPVYQRRIAERLGSLLGKDCSVLAETDPSTATITAAA